MATHMAKSLHFSCKPKFDKEWVYATFQLIDYQYELKNTECTALGAAGRN